MKLYTRAVLGLIAAFVLVYVVLATMKGLYLDPGRRALLREVNRPALSLAAESLRSADDIEAALAALKPHFGNRLHLESIGRASAEGWFVRDGKMYAYNAVADGLALVVGPFPSVDPSLDPMHVVGVVTPLIVAAIVAFLVVAPVIRRLRALERVTRRVAEGDLSARTDDSGRDAVASLSRRFNQMASEIERLVDNKKRLLQAVSHEFRTPTSRIRFELEMLETAEDAPERADHLRGIDDCLVEMDELVDELLTYVRFDNRHPTLRTVLLKPKAVAEAVASDLGVLRSEVTVRVTGDDAAKILANGRYFRRALSNLVLNAIRHAASDVVVDIRQGQTTVIIEVSDDGPGIPDADRERVFEPFARLEESRNRASGGAGLGLAIVRHICAWHAASVNVGDVGSGASLVVRWPAPPRDANEAEK